MSLCLALSPVRAQSQASSSDLSPVGYGALNQDQLSLRLRVDDIEVRFLPLDERLLRLVAKDGYESLHALVVDRQAQIRRHGKRGSPIRGSRWCHSSACAMMSGLIPRT